MQGLSFGDLLGVAVLRFAPGGELVGSCEHGVAGWVRKMENGRVDIWLKLFINCSSILNLDVVAVHL